jgi:hypothetical protein
MKPDLTKKAIAANIEAMRQILTDAVIRASEAFQPSIGPGGRHEKDHRPHRARDPAA